ncbi:hypothetical protein Taro_003760 [Colocasia esculenta]|uniref:Uncharacterized protein n=1 Tax=Colocasia esculenta TaxID=4460 RepID=A0A843TKM7_COLES|nr:hypothetical protein [Colocasia esculenta]
MMTRGTPCRDTSLCNHDEGHLTWTPRHVMMTRGTPRRRAQEGEMGMGMKKVVYPLKLQPMNFKENPFYL